jgi:hypothetical protein
MLILLSRDHASAPPSRSSMSGLHRPLPLHVPATDGDTYDGDQDDDAGSVRTGRFPLYAAVSSSRRLRPVLHRCLTFDVGNRVKCGAKLGDLATLEVDRCAIARAGPRRPEVVHLSLRQVRNELLRIGRITTQPEPAQR